MGAVGAGPPDADESDRDHSHGDPALRDEGAEIVGVAGEHLITRHGQQGQERVDDIGCAGGGQQFPCRTGVGEMDGSNIDHGEQPSQPGLPRGTTPGLRDDGGRRDQCGATAATEFDKPGDTTVVPIDTDKRARVE